MRKLPGESVRFESDARLLASIVSGNAKYSLIGMSAEEYPELPVSLRRISYCYQSGRFKRYGQADYIPPSLSTTARLFTQAVKFDISGNILKLIAIDGFRLRRQKREYRLFRR